jgi:putative OPT family oligopeptide transporter
MLVGAVNTLYGMRESILRSVRGAFHASAGHVGSTLRTRLDVDIPIKWTILATIGLVVPIAFIYHHFSESWKAALVAAVVMTGTGFFLAAVGGYLVGLVGSSNQPVSGLTLAALVVAALVMVGIGVKGLGGMAAVLGVASVVCCACCVSGSLIQDLKAGYLLGGTPWKMELVEILSVATLAFFLMFPIILLDQAHRATGGIGGRDLPAPQAGLMAQLTQGIVGGQMAWGLLLMGLAFGLALVMIKAPSPMLIAVGMYLPLETTGAIFVGGVMKWLAEKTVARQHPSAEQKVRSEEGGTLLASGFIAGEAITGILLPALFPTSGSITHLLTGRDELPFLASWGGWLSLIAFAVLGYSLIRLPLRRKA